MDTEPMNKLQTKLEQNLGWLLLALLLGGCLLVMRPFFSALLWGVVLSFAVWPVYQHVLRWLRGRRTLAAFFITFGMILVVLLPFAIIGLTLAQNVHDLSTATRRWLEAGPPEPPAWLGKVPVVGEKAVGQWQRLAEDSSGALQDAKKYIDPASVWLLKAGLSLGSGSLQLALSVILTFFFLRNGAGLADRLTSGIERIGGERGRHLLAVAGKTVRGVVYGILGTALAQAVASAIGFLIAGVPGAMLLALLTFFASVVPVLGTVLVWLPAALWLFYERSTGWGIFMLIWGVAVANIDNIIKPWLISQGSDMPFILIFFGVLGGAMAFGFIGVFIGPTLLAVGYRVVEEWISSAKLPPAEPEKTLP